ncbi:MAG: peptidoglycan editing factor PgeF [Candidatus Omnitrophica bacterium]|nr:peptidoglycan editing factor PgeF [Candidatus Omnitrophota bacterium]
MRFFEGQDVVAFISDKSMDFQPTDFDAPLLLKQREYLKKECSLDVPFVFWRKQVHGDDVLVAKDSPRSASGCPDADAYVTCQSNLPLAIRTADCVPILFFDPVKHAIGVAHAGWKGTHKEIALKTIERMKNVFGSKPEDIQVVLGPSIQPCCYQVGEEFRQYFPNEIIERAGKLYVDITKSNYKQLLKAGIKKENIKNTGICTCCNPKYFSFRRDAEKSGRMISLMVLL